MGSAQENAISHISLKTKIIGLFITVLAVLLVAFAAWTYVQQRDRMEAEVLERSRMLSSEMMATWEFVSLNQNVINYDSEGRFDYKGLHCALAGKSVAVLFGMHSSDIIRFTKLEPRNIYNTPDDFETEALLAFEANPAASEYYGFTKRNDSDVFRYVSVMEVTADCIECHGHPKGTIDITGYPKEGWSIGDLGGAMSIIIPADLYYENMRNSVATSVGFFLLIMALLVLSVYFALTKMITQPLEGLGQRLRQVDQNPSEAVQVGSISSVFGTRETEELFTRFNSMSEALSGLYRNLECQVEDRTRELAVANQELESQRAHVERVNERLQQENQYKSDFLAIVSHELRTPLTSILAFTELMASSVPQDNGKMRRQLDEIEKNGQTLLEMVNNVLETARIQAGSERLNLELVDLGDIINMVEASNESLALKKGITLDSVIEGNLPLITSDWEKVRRILTNLVSNAIKFTDKGGHVQVRAQGTDDGRWVVVSVIDDGIGIPADKHELVFERFTQENMSTQRRYGGSGLGLSLVRELAEMLGGSVRLESEQGLGSTFTVTLPVSGGVHGQDHAN